MVFFCRMGAWGTDFLELLPATHEFSGELRSAAQQSTSSVAGCIPLNRIDQSNPESFGDETAHGRESDPGGGSSVAHADFLQKQRPWRRCCVFVCVCGEAAARGHELLAEAARLLTSSRYSSTLFLAAPSLVWTFLVVSREDWRLFFFTVAAAAVLLRLLYNLDAASGIL